MVARATKIRFIAKLLSISLACLLSACSKPYTLDAAGKPTMQPSVTYLYLLRHTPFFKQLNNTQLRWVIGHSKEWEIDKGGVIATNQSTPDYWLLLDGSWQLICQQQNVSKEKNHTKTWFHPSEIQLPCELVAASPSFVMRIQHDEMQIMLENGFPFELNK